MNTKAQVRHNIKTSLRLVAKGEFHRRNQSFLRLHEARMQAELPRCKWVACFEPFKTEPKVLEMALGIVPKSKICLPNVSDLEVGQMDFFPKGAATSVEPLHPEEIDFVFVPGLAFDVHGVRLGRGLGFYDRYLNRLKPNCLRVGVAWDEQVLPEGQIPQDLHDERVDEVWTETRIHRGDRRRH